MKTDSDNLENLIKQVIADIAVVKKYIEDSLQPSKPPEPTQLNVEDAARYISRSKNTIYQYASKRVLPFSKPNGKEIVFLKTDLDEFLNRNRRKSMHEIAGEVDETFAKKRRAR